MNISNGGNKTKEVFYTAGKKIKEIKSFDVIIRDDQDKNYHSFKNLTKKAFYFNRVNFFITDNMFKLWIYKKSSFNCSDFQKTSYNRGWIYIIYN
jgi:hypothetical protein